MKVRKTKNGLKFISENMGNDNLAIVALGLLLDKIETIPENIYNNNGGIIKDGKYLNFCEIPFNEDEIIEDK